MCAGSQFQLRISKRSAMLLSYRNNQRYLALPKRASEGITLVELIVAVAVVGILAAIVMPSYRESVAESKRLEAQTALAALALAVERYYSRQQPPSYLSATAGGVFHSYAPIGTGATSATATYLLCVGDRGDSVAGSACPSKDSGLNYQLFAIPLNSQAGDGCGVFSLSDIGAKTVLNASKSSGECWK